MDLVEKANEDAEQTFGQEMKEGSDDAPMEKMINDCVKLGIAGGLKPMQAELEKLKQQLRAKDTREEKADLKSPDLIVKNIEDALSTRQRRRKTPPFNQWSQAQNAKEGEKRKETSLQRDLSKRR